jgi:hypothetical protein
MVTSALVGALMVGVSLTLSKLRQAMTVQEADSRLKATSEAFTRALQEPARTCVRIFSRATGSLEFLTRTTAPTALPGTAAPMPSQASPSGNQWGNRFMFLSRWKTTDVDLGGATSRFDLYRFHQFFPVYGDGVALGVRRRELVHWTSVPYVNANNLLDIVDGATRSGCVAALYQHGYRWAFEPGSTHPDEGVYALDAAGTMSAVTGHLFATAEVEYLTRGSNEVGPGGFRVSLAPNITAAQGLRHVVPLNATAAGEFPSGFEVGIGGMQQQERFVQFRLVTLAQGSFKSPKTRETLLILSIRDAW